MINLSSCYYRLCFAMAVSHPVFGSRQHIPGCMTQLIGHGAPCNPDESLLKVQLG